MRKTLLTLTVLAAAMVGGEAMAAPRAKMLFEKQKKETGIKKQKGLQRARIQARATAEANTIYKPLEETYYFYDDGEWLEAMNASYTYDDQGRVLTVVSTTPESTTWQNRTSYKYDTYGNITQILEESSTDGGKNWEPSSKYENEYDDVVTDFRTATLMYAWDYEWVLRYGTKYAITRNSGKVVTGAERLTNFQDEFTPIARLTNTVGNDGKITAVKEEELGVDGADYVWEEYFDYRDIVWENTDGQALGFDPENYAVGANRIKAAKLYFEGEPEADVTGEYTDEQSGRLEIEFYAGDALAFEHAVLDDFGSYVDERTLQYTEDDEVFTETELYEVTYNERGRITLETASYLYDEEEYVEKLIYDYTIDPDKDAVCQTLTSVYNSEDDETVPETKVVVTAFTGLSGLAAVSVDATEIACRLSGRSLEISSPGATAVSVFTTDGRLAASKAGADWFSLDLNGLSTGFYIVRVAGQGATRTFKIALK